MRITIRTRRAAALLAASTLTCSTLVLGVAGVASATIAPAPITADDDYAVASDGAGNPTSVTIRDGFCTAFIDVIGGEGGAGTGTPAGPAGEVQALIPVTPGQVFAFHVGRAATGDTGGTSSDDPTANGTAGSTGGGGGGAGSSLTLNGGTTPVASAPGGDGGGPAGGTGGGGMHFDSASWTVAGVGVPPFTGSTADSPVGSNRTGDGQVAVAVHACDAPYAPNVRTVDARDTGATVSFYPENGDPVTAAPTGYEYRLGVGDWTPVTTVKTDPADPDPTSERQFTLSGLTPGRTYSLELRATSRFNGPGAASGAQAFTPTHVVAAPADVHATVGGDSVHLTWNPPPGETGITGYEAWVLPGADPQSDNGLVHCPALDASARECTLVVPAGSVYSATVVALNPARGDWGTVVTDVVPAPSAPATLPAGSGPLSTPTGAPSGLAQGSTVTLTGSGYAPGSTVGLYVYSTPTLLGTVVVDGTGSFSRTVTLPAALAPGAHHLVAAGVDPSGQSRYLTSAITVAQASGTLAWTGFEALPALLGGGAAVALGAALLVVARRRRTA